MLLPSLLMLTNIVHRQFIIIIRVLLIHIEQIIKLNFVSKYFRLNRSITAKWSHSLFAIILFQSMYTTACGCHKTSASIHPSATWINDGRRQRWKFNLLFEVAAAAAAVTWKHSRLTKIQTLVVSVKQKPNKKHCSALVDLFDVLKQFIQTLVRLNVLVSAATIADTAAELTKNALLHTPKQIHIYSYAVVTKLKRVKLF